MSQTWLIRVAQEFEVEVKDANEALALAAKYERRTPKGAKLIDSRCALAPKDRK